jgi:hypothetical protein
VDDARTRSMHSAKYRNAAATCDLIFVNSAYTGRDVTATLGVPASGSASRTRRRSRSSVRTGSGRRPRLAVRPHRRDARAAQEPRGARRALTALAGTAHSRSSARGVGGAAAARRAGHQPARLSSRTTSSPACTAGPRSSPTRRGSRVRDPA